ncbi:integrin alpha-3-like [Cyprinus carpio]|uniref:Integrin alpha-3-like n=1 Tax=Cyprinus carpio TaxID=7962 RepID=A0A9Q9YNZ0_CYPCA|nr:integrin alpha-3-like [Cyprinus carpio]XP_042623136.1 integrin alpha-3-like [Cyprinus carpio]
MAGKCLQLCVFVICAIQTSTGFNIDVQFPVIKEGKTKGSLFGFSVALHKQTEKTKKNFLLAGAPQEKAQPQLSKFNINETGAVYYCPISIEQDDCRRMDLISPPQSSEMVEGMWLGVTVASQRNGGHVLACGHRYVKKLLGAEEHQRMVGKCYVRGNDLTYDPTDYWQSDTYELCDFNYDQNLEGMCNMGISGGMTENDVYFGTPGSFVWQGTVHMKERDPNFDFAGDANEISFGKLGEDKLNIYIGYSVLEDIKLLDRSKYTVVTGAPRDNFRGSVILAEKQGLVLNPVMTIPGEQIGSYFGSCLAVTDLNNDDWNDLIVGAPFYFDRNKEEGGAVYIFMNENGSFQKKASLVLKGKKGSGFGFAVAAVGDINQDGFQDLAVGAPFQDSGKVFLWMGSKNGITKEPSQVIEGKSLGPSGFQTFGYSLSGGMDMDGNDYPDILVGSMDDRIALLRARPVIHLSQNLTVEPKIVIPNQCVNSCIKVKVCFSYNLSTGNTAFKKDITVKYTVDADPNRRGARVRFLDNKQSTFTGLLSFSTPACQELELSVHTPVRDKLQPIVFTLNVSLNEQKAAAQQTLQSLDAFPVLSGQQTLTSKTEINFHKECGVDNTCSSNLQLKAKFADENYIPFPSQTMEFNSNIKKLVMMVNVTNMPDGGKQEAEDAHQATLSITIPPSLKYSGVRPLTGLGIECSADETVICDLGNPFKSNHKTSLIIIFETSGVTLYTKQIESQLQLSTISEQKDLDPVSVTLNVKNTVLTTFSLEKQVIDTTFSGSVIGESAMNSISDVGSPLEFVFRVHMQGEPLGDLGTLMIDFEWPYEVANGKWLLYLTEIVIKGALELHCVPPGKIVNPLNLTLSDRGTKRSKRAVESGYPQAEASVTVLAPRKVPHFLECSKMTARCVTFSCPLHNMSTQTEIRVRSRVWNSTLLEDYANALRVEVKGQATLRLLTDKPAIRMDNQTREFSVNIDPVLGEETPYEVPLWIIIVSAVAGILLLGIISLILWKCGFFRRASRREMYEAKSQKAEIKIQPSETERLTEEF